MHIELNQQNWQAKKSGFRNLGISMDIPRLYHVYTSNDMDIPHISEVDIRSISMDITCISTLFDSHGKSMDIPSLFHVFHEYTMYIPFILVRTTYTWNIHGIYQAYTENTGSRGMSLFEVTVLQAEQVNNPYQNPDENVVWSAKLEMKGN